MTSAAVIYTGSPRTASQVAYDLLAEERAGRCDEWRRSPGMTPHLAEALDAEHWTHGASDLRRAAEHAVDRLEWAGLWATADVTVVRVGLAEGATAEAVALALGTAARCREDIGQEPLPSIDVAHVVAAGLLRTTDGLVARWAAVVAAVDAREDLLVGGLPALDRHADLPSGADRYGCWVGLVDALDAEISRYGEEAVR
jgi:hypothetical protein